MPNETNIQGSHNVIIQGISDSTLTLNVNGEVREIQNQLAELKALLQNLKIHKVQYAEKIYNIEHINEANFSIVTSSRVFNGILTKELIDIIKDRPKPRQFLEDIPVDDKENWECVRTHLKDAQSLLEDNFVWVISWELRRLFSIGNDKQKSNETKTFEYINHCLSTYRLSLQLVNYLFLSKLWDEKRINKNLENNQRPIKDFFYTNRILKLVELRLLFQSLLKVFKDNGLQQPISEGEFENFHEYLDNNSNFNGACLVLEAFEMSIQSREAYGLGHCHTAEIALSTILKAFKFFTNYQLVTMKRVEYEEARNTAPRYVKDFSILEKKEAKNLQRILKYDNRPSLTYAIFFRNEHNAVNLFPFLLDYNALTNEQDFQIYIYESRIGKNALRYFSIKSEKEDTISYMGIATEPKEIKSEEQKNEEQKNIRLDLVIKQFEEAMNTILDADEHFQPKTDTLVDKLDNF